MYCGVPTRTPSLVVFDAVAMDPSIEAAPPRSLAMPKSSSLAPFLVSMTLAGFRSR
jgi:hypothetical protein